MKNLQKWGGIASLYLAAAYLAGIILFLVVLDYPNITEPVQKVKLLVDKTMIMYITNLLMYIIFGFFLIILSSALYKRLKSVAPVMGQIAMILGIIWAGLLIASGMVANAGINPIIALYEKSPAQATSFWLGIETVANGLGGANGEILGGVFTLLISLAAFKDDKFPKIINYLGILVGAIGIVSVIPMLNDLTGIFGMTQLLWFVWLGIVLLRQSSMINE